VGRDSGYTSSSRREAWTGELAAADLPVAALWIAAGCASSLAMALAL
jgi:hypothetical protein